MTSSRAALIAALLFLPASSLQEDPKAEKEKARQELKKKEEEAKAALKAYREERAEAKETDDHVRAVDKLGEADPHALIRTELLSVLNGPGLDPIRTAAAEALHKYKKDPAACDALIRHAKSREGADLRKRCLKSFGTIATFGRSTDLQVLFNEDDSTIARQAVDAVDAIGSVRMLRPLVDLLGELEQIREGRDPAPPPGSRDPRGGDSGDDHRIRRKKELLDPTKKAISTLWSKHGLGKAPKDATEATAVLAANRPKLKKIQEDEDAQDRGR
ncbi:MAG TPA: hypothetical protein VGK61_04030 [Planctomycetota bacterium]|jgi:hypothetical protein